MPAAVAGGLLVLWWIGMVRPRQGRLRRLRRTGGARMRAPGTVVPGSRWSLPRAGRDGGGGSMVQVLATVSAAVRAGSDPASAWVAAGVSVDPDGVPRPSSLLALAGAGKRRWQVGAWGWAGAAGMTGALGRAGAVERAGAVGRAGTVGRADAAGREEDRRLVLAVVVAARIAASAGAPLAGVLDRVRAACEASADVEAERAAALAGPMASGRLLGWLPVGGVLLAALLGADPVGSALGGGVGTAAAVTGLCLLAVGRWWLRHLVTVAARAGRESSRAESRR